MNRWDAMLEEIAAEAVATAGYTGRAAFDARVMAAMAKVPRHQFVTATEEEYAYLNEALAIGHGQTISQPYIVALMTDLLVPGPEHRIMEIGTGSGYQAAILAELVKHVYSIEVIPELAEQARERLARLGYRTVSIKIGDGNEGWPEHAPFDGIVVTAASRKIPTQLLSQLTHGGRMVIPLGGRRHQVMTIVEKSKSGMITERGILPVAFVPLVSSRTSSRQSRTRSVLSRT
ncbi:MAG: protein-L-isoaspartate(D-aspartate) O-methyltransferase [Phycisphaerales bacterium]|nr:protein-L-isoaspartate(D-aspartate) O-methyltransferase [Phycisphaerales bacterium]